VETKFQTSFIPKTTIAPVAEFKPRRQTSLLLVISFFIFLVSVLLGGLAFGYHKLVEKNKADTQANLESNIKAFQPDTIRSYARLDSRIDTAKLLLERHIALSYFLDFLSRETLKSVRFLDMKYALSPDGKTANIDMNGQTGGNNYNAVAFQSTVFGKNSSLQNIIFSNLDLDKGGNVVFNLGLKLDPSFVYYKKRASEFMNEGQAPTISLEEQVDRQ